MPTQKDLKRLVRARMRKTGEAYTAARAQIVNKSKPVVPAPAAVKIDYAALAGMSDAKVKDATGCTWERWVRALDRLKAHELTHAELAKLIKSKYKTPDWWTQTVAVGYERIKGLRARGQGRDGKFAATKSRTFKVPVETLFDAWADSKQRAQWLTDKNVRIRKSTRARSIRLEQDGAIIAVGFTRLGAAKSSVAIEESRLPSRDAVAEVKKYWGERFDALGALLAPA